jgi:hypothetical protein
MNQVDTKRQDRLYNLLPVVYRQRDLEQGSPLQMLLRVIAEQVNLLEDDIGQLYENWFIETCADWVVPYIGDVIGYHPVRSAGEASDELVGPLDRILTPRREVANTVSYRRRKGTLALLDELSLATAGWPARAVEFNRYLGVSQNLEHLRETRGRIANLRDVTDLDLLGTAFDTVSHSVDVRSSNSPNTQGRYNVASVGLFVWRLRVYTASRTPAYCVEDAGDHCYTFSILGNDLPLYTHVVPGASTSRIPGELDLPTRIRRRAFAELVNGEWRASEKYYGSGKSVAIWAAGWAGLDPGVPIPRDRVIPADLGQWRYRPKPGYVAVDPELGRISFPPGQEPEGDVFTSYCYGFSAEIGGGEYSRPIIVSPGHSSIYYVGAGQDFPKILDAYEKWRREKPAHAVVEITDSGVYAEELHIELEENQTLEVRAADGARPIIFLVDLRAGRPDPISVVGATGSSLTLDGLLVTGRGIEVQGKLDEFVLRHCTLVPGWALHPDCRPHRPDEPSLVLDKTSARVRIEHSILGPIHVSVDTGGKDPLPFHIEDSVIDGTSFGTAALCAPEREIAGVALTLRRSTVLGEVHAHVLTLAENSIFMGQIRVARRQLGCVRFCYVPLGSRTPKRFHCQPDVVDLAVRDQGRLEQLHQEELKALVRVEQFRVEPAFMSTRYGSPNYCRLADYCAPEIKTGANDRSELGVFHDLYQPQREANLRARLAEFTPAGTDAGIFFAN